MLMMTALIKCALQLRMNLHPDTVPLASLTPQLEVDSLRMRGCVDKIRNEHRRLRATDQARLQPGVSDASHVTLFRGNALIKCSCRCFQMRRIHFFSCAGQSNSGSAVANHLTDLL